MGNFITKRLKAFGFAFAGLKTFVKEGIHAKIMLLAALLAICMAAYFKVNMTEWLTIILCCGLVLTAEAINSALEYLTDLSSPEEHPLAKKAKDVAAASALIASFAALAAGLIIFVPRIISLL